MELPGFDDGIIALVKTTPEYRKQMRMISWRRP